LRILLNGICYTDQWMVRGWLKAGRVLAEAGMASERSEDERGQNRERSFATLGQNEHPRVSRPRISHKPYLFLTAL